MGFNPPTSPLNYPANNVDPARIFRFDRAPTTGDFQNFKIRDFWIDSSSDDLYFLVDKPAKSATWISLGGVPGTGIERLTGNTGGAVEGDGTENINILGSSPITVTGNPGTNTLTIESDGTLADEYVTDAGSAIPVAGILNVVGGTSIDTAGAADTVTINAGTDIATTYIADSGSAIPVANNLNIFGINGINTIASGNTVTINASASSISSNLGFTFNVDTFALTAADGSSLSSINPAYVRVGRKNLPGQYLWIKITANQSFIDASGSSEIIGNLFGLTTSIAHPDFLPFFIYAVLNDNENDIAFMISRYPITDTSPVAAKIGQSGTPIATTQGSFFSLKSITATDYESNPCVGIGSFRMSMNASNDWTVAPLVNSDGIGLFQKGERFKVTLGQFGAKANNVFIDNGGTAPNIISSGNPINFEIIDAHIVLDLNAVFTSTGSGAVSLIAKMPYTSEIGGFATTSPFMIASSGVPTWIGTTAVNSASNSLLFYATNPNNIRQIRNSDALNTLVLHSRAFCPVDFLS